MPQPCNEYPKLDELKAQLTETIGELIRKGMWEEVKRLHEMLANLDKDASSVDCDELLAFLPDYEMHELAHTVSEKTKSSEAQAQIAVDETSSEQDGGIQESEEALIGDVDRLANDSLPHSKIPEDEIDRASLHEVEQDGREDAWEQLDALRSDPPRNLADLPAFIEKTEAVRNKLGDALFVRPEGKRAHQEWTLLAGVEKQYREAERFETQALQALAKKDVLSSGSYLQDLRTQLERVRDNRDLREQFPDLYWDFVRTLEGMEAKVAADREALAQNLRTTTTRATTKNTKELVALLSELESWTAPTIPVDPASKIYADIKMWTTDVGMMANRVDVVRAIRGRLVQISVQEAKRLIAEGMMLLTKDRLSLRRARDRYEHAKYFASIEAIKDAGELKEVHDELEALQEKLSEWEEKKAHAESLLKNAQEIKEDDPVTALKQLQQAQELYPPLLGLEGEISGVSKIWRALLRRQVDEAKRESRRLGDQRDYDHALAVLEQTRATVLSPAAEALAEFAGIAEFRGYLTEINQQEDALRDEQMAWKQFVQRKEELKERKRPPIKEGRLDEEAVRRFIDVKENYLEGVFKDDWEALKNDLTDRAGAAVIYQRALELFKQNPADPGIATQLDKITEEDFFERARTLRKRHLAYAALSQAEQLFEGQSSCEEDENIELCKVGAEAWQQHILSLLDEARKNALFKGALLDESDQELIEKINDLETATNALAELRRQVDPALNNEDFGDAWDIVNEQRQDDREGWEAYFQQGITLLLKEIQSRWGEHVENFLRDRIFDDLNQLTPKTDGIELQDIRNANLLLQALEERDIRAFEMQGLAAQRVDDLEKELELGSLLGLRGEIVPVWEKEPDELIALIQQRSRQFTQDDWEKLLSILDELQKKTGKTSSSLTGQTAYDLWFLSLIYFAVNDTTGRSVQEIQNAREDQSRRWLATQPILCGMLAVHYLNQLPFDVDENRYEQDGMEMLLDSLSYSRGNEDLIAALQTMKAARDAWLEDDYSLAQKRLDDGMKRLVALSDFDETQKPVFADAMREARDHLLRDWQESTCEKKRQEFTEARNNWKSNAENDPLAIFDVLQKGQIALTVCCPDKAGRGAKSTQSLRYASLSSIPSESTDHGPKWYCFDHFGLEKDVKELLRESEERIEELSERVDDLLQSSVTDIKDAILRGNQLLERLAVVDQMQNTQGRVGRQIKQLKNQITEVKDQVERWESTLDTINLISSQLVKLFQGKWTWTDEERMNPLRDLKRFREKLEKESNSYHADIPSELEDMLNLVVYLEDTCFDIGERYVRIKAKFESEDGLASEDDFDMLTREIKELEKSINEAKKQTAKLLKSPNRKRFQLNWDNHFEIHDEFPIPTSPRRSEKAIPQGIDIVSPYDLKKAVDRRKDNAKNWKQWVEEVKGSLNSFQHQEKEIRMKLRRRGLGIAKEYWQEMRETIDGIERYKNDMPIFPRSRAALDEATNIADFEPQSEELEELWLEIEEASNLSVRAAWEAFLDAMSEYARDRYSAFEKQIEKRELEWKDAYRSIQDYVKSRRSAFKENRLRQEDVNRLERMLDKLKDINANHPFVKNYERHLRQWRLKTRSRRR